MQKVLDLEKRLYGNGQPGDIGRLQVAQDETNERVAKLEEFKWKALGAFSAVVSIIGFLTGDGVFSLRNLIGR